jgi:hypothetical protein
MAAPSLAGRMARRLPNPACGFPRQRLRNPEIGLCVALRPVQPPSDGLYSLLLAEAGHWKSPPDFLVKSATAPTSWRMVREAAVPSQEGWLAESVVRRRWGLSGDVESVCTVDPSLSLSS